MPNPKPSSHWQSDREYAGWTWDIVEVPIEKYFGPAEKIDIAMLLGVLPQIDCFTEA
jgi:hypothetical protein